MIIQLPIVEQPEQYDDHVWLWLLFADFDDGHEEYWDDLMIYDKSHQL